MEPQPTSNQKHLDLATIQRLARFSFVPRRFIDGRFAGRHASTQRGQSIEFRDYRPYLPGDDVSQIDWKVFGRTDKLYLRMFEHETELCATLLVDGSNSMSYGLPSGERKYDHACRLAAAIGFVILQAQDRCGFGIARGGLQHHQRPSAALPQLKQMLHVMQDDQPSGLADLPSAVDRLAEQLVRGEIVIIFSDFWDDVDGFFQSVARINHSGGEVIAFHVLHQDELLLPAWGDAVVMDSESRERLQANFSELRADYQRRLQVHCQQFRDRCRRHDVQYQFAPMTRPFEKTLERFLVRRCAA